MNESHNKEFLDIQKYPKMTEWFTFSVLKNTLSKVIYSTIFGQYADSRLTQAALMNVKSEDDFNFSDERTSASYWIDYVADLGDGFEPTYSIAYLLAQQNLEINGETLPQGNILIMGGDSVYPVADNDDYRNKLIQPYEDALPQKNCSEETPKLFLLPGNHDWYDGLGLFITRFCNGRNKFGNSGWQLFQSRSYFVINLPNDWSIWGIDSQLSGTIDIPQAEYFKRQTQKLQNIKNLKIILCVSSPVWSENKDFQDKLNDNANYIASKIIKKNLPKAKIFTVITGDLHHYSRYQLKKNGTNFITSGGGGAFLHPTHQLPTGNRRIEWQNSVDELVIAKKNNLPNEDIACYPSQKESKKLGRKAYQFFCYNPKFCLILAAVYALMIILINATKSNQFNFSFSLSFFSVLTSRLYIPVGILLLLALRNYAYRDNFRTWTVLSIAIIHAIFHFIILTLAATLTIYICNLLIINQNLVSNILYFLNVTIVALVAGFLGSLLWGVYLGISSALKLHSNDSFSSFRYKGYKNFLRIQLNETSLTIYAIGLKDIPKRPEWSINDQYNGIDKNEPKFILKNKRLNPIIIEKFSINDSDFQEKESLNFSN